MTRHALIIGLGGTGQWVLTYLKRDLIESNHGAMPDNVRLLCFDTLPQAGAEIGGGAERRDDGQVEISGVRLETGEEFVHLGGDVYELSRHIAKDTLLPPINRSQAHLSSWFQADYWLRNLPRASFVLAAGAGKLRQFGRLALFSDLKSPLTSEILRRLEVTIDQLAAKRRGEQRIEIIIVGSFAGGTGAGMFIDMALLARRYAQKTPHMIRGYFALPGAFQPNPDDDMLARGFAAWRELNRFMVVSQDFGLPGVSYVNSSQSDLQQGIRTKLFDACYLVDGMRNGARLPAEVEQGVFPSIADAISATLDDEAGENYTEWIVTNLAPHYAAMPDVPLYSVLGTHAYKVPVYYAQQVFVNRFTHRWLDELLNPRKDVLPTQRIMLDPANPDNPTSMGRDEALVLLTARQEYQSPASLNTTSDADVPPVAPQSEEPTSFFKQLADILNKPKRDRDALIDRYARGSSGNGLTWTNFTDLGNRQDELAQIRRRVDDEQKWTLISVIKPSKDFGEPAAGFPRRVEADRDRLVREHYGVLTANRQRNNGRYGVALDECRDAQLSIFQRLVRLWLLKTLMSGRRGGRLGYAYDLLLGLKERLETFVAFMDKVETKRRELQPSLALEKARTAAKRQMEDYSQRQWLPLLSWLDHPQAHISQQTYLRAEQALINVLKDEILHVSVNQTVKEMLLYVVRTSEELDRWVSFLASGDAATNVTGIYELLRRQGQVLEQARQADERLHIVQTMLKLPDYPEAEAQAEIERLMESVIWNLDENQANPRLKMTIMPAGEPEVCLDLPLGQQQSNILDQLAQENLQRLQRIVGRRFRQLLHLKVAAEQLRVDYRNPQELSRLIGRQAEPLFDPNPGQPGNAAVWTEMIHINTEHVDASTRTFMLGGFDLGNGQMPVAGLEQERRTRRGLDPVVRAQNQMVTVVGSTNPHKCTIIRTDDLMGVEFFRAWHQCQAAYLRNRGLPPHLNHNFPAEANAVRYERKFALKRRMQYRVFHPWVVMLLEYPERLDQFLLCLMLTWVQPQNNPPSFWYQMDLPSNNTLKRPFMLTPREETPPSIFQVARAFVLDGLDRTPGSDWWLPYDSIRSQIEGYERSDTVRWKQHLSVQVGNIASAGVVNVPQMLRQRADALGDLRRNEMLFPVGEPTDFGRAYQDLADVALLMFEDREDQGGLGTLLGA